MSAQANAIRRSIARWKQHMYAREMSHDFYFLDPNGRDADRKHLRDLERQLEEVCRDTNAPLEIRSA